MAWVSWNLKDSVAIKSLGSIESSLAPVTSALEGILEFVKAIAEIAAKFDLDVSDPSTAALRALIDAVRAVLEDLTEDAGCYFLPIPLRLKNVIPEDTLIFDPTPGGPEAADLSNIFLPPVGGSITAGNYGFMKDVMDSLADRNDILRPQFDEDAHVAALVIVAGASSYLDMLPLVAKLKRLFAGKKRKSSAGEGMASPDYPKLRGLKATIVPSAVGALEKRNNRLFGDGSATHPYAVKLEWDLPERIIVEPNGDNRYTFTIKKVGVFRSETRITQTTNPTTLASDYALKDFEFDGLTNEFYDDTIELNRTYYYAAGYEIEAKWDRKNVNDEFVLQGTTTYDASTEVQVTSIDIPQEINVLPRSGTPPDWTLLATPLSIIPDLMDVVDSVNLFLDSLEKRLETQGEKSENYIQTLSNEIRRYGQVALNVISTIQDIIDLVTFPDVYIGVTTLAGKGGNQFFVNALGRALTDGSDASRPPFDQGDEAVTGFILYAGSATLGKLQAFTDLIQTLTGVTEDSIAQAYKDAADSIGYVIDVAEREICILQNLERGECPSPEEELPGLGPDLEPASEENESSECQP